MLTFNLKQILLAKGINEPYKWLRSKKISHGVAHRLLTNKAKSIQHKHLQVICEQAYCTPNDLFTWEPTGVFKEMKTHPLYTLDTNPAVDITPILKSLTKYEMQQMQIKMMELLKERDAKQAEGG